VALASAGPYINCMHLTSDNHASTSSLKCFYRPDALPGTQATESHVLHNL